MQNPILQMLNGKKNPNKLLQNLSAAKSLISQNDPDRIFNFLINSNPNFRNFVKNAENKTIEDIALEYDLDLDMVKQLLK